MANGGKITYDIGFNVDKSGLADLQKQLNELMKTIPSMLSSMNPGVFKNVKSDAQSTLYYIKQDLQKVQTAFNDAFNPKTGLMNLKKLNVALNEIGVKRLSQDFGYLGEKGQQAFYQMTKSALTANMQLKKTNTLMDKMGTTLINTLKWTLSSSLINRVVGTLQQAVGYVEHLDSSLNDIRIVTKKSADEMDSFAQKANKAAQALGKATTDYTEASLIYYQQGLSDEEVQARAETTLKAANVTGQATKTVSEQLTSVWNGFKVNAEDTEKYVDKLAAVAAMSASNLQELSTGMSKVASAASNLGVDIDQLTAQISTIVSVTRQAPESVGTALKTIYARISDLKLGESDEDGLGLGDVSGGLEKLGINVLDAQGELRDLGVVIEEVAAKWDTWTSAQQAAIAQLMAGKRQYNNLVALFSNWDMYTNALKTSKNATGELQKQQDIYMESTEAHLQQLKTQWEDLYDSLLDTKVINNFADGLTKVIKLLTNFVDGIGGGSNLFLLLGSTALRVFDKQIGRGIANMIAGFQRGRENAAQLKAQVDNINFFKQTQQYQDIPAVKALVDAQASVSKYYDILSNEQINAANELAMQVGEVAQLKTEWEKSADALNDYARVIQAQSGNKLYPYPKDEKGTQGSIDLSSFDFKTSKSVEALKALQNGLKDSEKDVDIFSKSIKSLGNFYMSTSKKGQTIKKSITDLRNEVQKVKEPFEKLNEQGLFKDVDPTTISRIEQAFNTIGRKNVNFDKATEALQTLKTSLKELPSSAKEVINEFLVQIERGNNIKFDAAQRQLDQFLHDAAIQQFTTNIVNGIGAVGQFAGSINSLKNGFDVLSDSSLSAGEKITQFLSSFGMGATILITSGKKLVDSFVSINAAANTLNATKREAILANAGLLGSNIVLNEEQLASIGITKDTIVVKEGETVATAMQAAATDAENIALVKNIALRKALNPLVLGITAGLAALVVSISLITSHYQKLREEAIAAQEEIIRVSDASQKSIDKEKDEVSGLQELIQKYQEGTISLKEFNDQKIQILGTMDAVGQAALNQAASWKEAQAALDNYNAHLADKTLETQIKKRNAAMQKAFADMDSGAGNYNESTGNFEYRVSFDRTIGDSFEEQGKDYIQALKDAGILTEQSLPYQNPQYVLEFTIAPNEKGLDQLQQIWDLQQKYSNNLEVKASSIYRAINEEYNQYIKSDSYDIINEATSLINDARVTQAIKTSEVNLKTTTEGIKESKEIFFKELENTGLSEEEKIQAWKDILTNSSQQAAKDLIKEEANISQMLGNWGYKGQPLELTHRYENTKQIYQRLIEEGIKPEEISAVSSDEWYSILFKNLSNEEIIEKAKAKIESKVGTIIDRAKEGIAQHIEETSNGVESSLADAIVGNLDVTTEDFQKLLQTLNDIKEVYPEYINEIETFSNTGLVGTEHWIQAAYNLQTAIDKIEFDKLNKKVDEAKEKLDDYFNRKEYDDKGFEVVVEADTEKFSEAMQELMDAEYRIDVEVHSDAERDFTQLVNSMKQADELAAKIGEDFIVAADDIRELNNAFPGILEGIQYLGDGTIQLNEEIVQSAMNAANQQEIASTEELNIKLQNAADELEAKAVVYDTMADIAHQAAMTEIDENSYQSQLAAELNKLDVENDEKAANAEITNAKAVSDNSNENARISAANWTKSYQQAADASFRFAQNAIENAKAAAAGPDGVPVKASGGNFNFTWGGSGGTSSSELVSSTEFRKPEDVKTRRLEDEAKFRALAEAARAGRNDIDGMIAAVAAKLQDSVNKNLGVGKKSSDSNGSKGGGSSKDPEQLDLAEREEDIYRIVNEELEEIESKLSRIQKIQSHRWGVSYKKNLEQENKLLDQQLKKLQEKNKLQQEDLSIRRKQLEDVNVQFSDDGSTMYNIEEVLNELYVNYNAMVIAYNNMTVAQQEVAKAELENEKVRIENIEKLAEEYENLFSEFNDNIDKQLELHYAQIENEIKQFNVEVEIHLELKEAEREWDKFWSDIRKQIDDSDFAQNVADSLVQASSYIDEANAILTHSAETFVEVEKLLAGDTTGLFGDDINAAKEELEKQLDQIKEKAKAVADELHNVREEYMKGYESMAEAIEKQIKGWETINKHIEHNIELIKLIDGEDAYEALNKQFDVQYQNNLKLVQAQKIRYDQWTKEVAILTELAKTVDKNTEEGQAILKSLEYAQEQLVEADEALQQTTINSIQQLQEWRDNVNSSIFDTLDKSLSSGMGLDLLEEEWKLIDDYSSKYYDNVERYLNMEEYTNTLNEAANAIGLSAENQQKLNAFREQELDQLSKKEKLTEYDIAESKARLEIMKAQMALEDAQRNKSNMRLRRDSQGNYTYQYTANEDTVNDAEAGILTAKKEWYELVKKRAREAGNEIIQINKDIAELTHKYQEAVAAGNEEAAAKYLELLERAKEQTDFWFGEAEKNKRDIYKGTAQYFAQVENAEMLPQFESTVSKMVDKWAGGGKESFLGAVKSAINELNQAQAEFKANTDEVLTAAGLDYKAFAEEGIDPAREALEELTTDNDTFSKSLDETSKKLGNVRSKMAELQKQYDNLAKSAKEAGEALLKYLDELSKMDVSVPEVPKVDASKDAPAIQGGNSTGSSSSGGGGGGGNNGNTPYKDNGVDNPGTGETGYKVTYTDSSGGHSYSLDFADKSKAKDTAASKLATGSLHVTILDKANKNHIIQANYDQIKNVPSAQRLQIAKQKFSSFYSGGYTGAWGDNGKLGILHEKELVLNKQDTANILDAVRMLRALPLAAIASSIVGSASTNSLLGGIGSSVQALAGSVSSVGDTTKNMTVNADFSGVRSADAIYQALVELENYGLQNSYSVAPHANSMY